jgi:hypothetical protein
MLSLTTRMRIYLIYFFLFCSLYRREKSAKRSITHPLHPCDALFLPSLFCVCVCVPPVFTVVPMGGVGKKEARHDDVIGRYI